MGPILSAVIVKPVTVDSTVIDVFKKTLPKLPLTIFLGIATGLLTMPLAHQSAHGSHCLQHQDQQSSDKPHGQTRS